MSDSDSDFEDDAMSEGGSRSRSRSKSRGRKSVIVVSPQSEKTARKSKSRDSLMDVDEPPPEKQPAKGKQSAKGKQPERATASSSSSKVNRKSTWGSTRVQKKLQSAMKKPSREPLSSQEVGNDVGVTYETVCLYCQEHCSTPSHYCRLRSGNRRSLRCSRRNYPG